MKWQWKILNRFWVDIVLIVLSATFLVLIFPPFDMPYFAYIALVPLILIVKRSGPLKAFIYSMVVGFLFNVGIQWWGLKMESFNPVNFSIGGVGVAFFYGLFGLSASYFQRKYPKWNALTFSTTWVLLEYLRSHIGFLSWPWGILGYSQFSVIPVVQISTFTGVYGVSFLIVAVNTVITEIMCLCLSRSQVKIFHGLPSPGNLKTSLNISEEF
jgi:apolipoprotein N-acyltransferase